MNEFEFGGNMRGIDFNGSGRQDKQLHTYDYLADVPGGDRMCEYVEVQFKNTRKDYYVNSNHLPLKKGDMVAVEASPGHDVGVVSLTGALVELQMKKTRIRTDVAPKRVYRIAKDTDLQKSEEAKMKEHETMIKSRQIAKDLGLEMKIGDVEYQGDGNKAIFYYIADGRVDFRQLIKVLAEEFHVRIEMKQIGARQEAGRIGGTGPCGRELCCAAWMKNFVTVSTGAARCQDVSLNPQKLAGQCAKLKCCLNFEVSAYTEAAAKLPHRDIVLETEKATYYYFKSDILAGLVSYSTDKHLAENIVTITAQRAKQVAMMNNEGIRPENLCDENDNETPTNLDLAAQESVTRFDKSKKKKKNRNRKNNPSSEVRTEGESIERTEKTASTTEEQPRNRHSFDRRDGGRRSHSHHSGHGHQRQNGGQNPNNAPQNADATQK